MLPVLVIVLPRIVTVPLLLSHLYLSSYSPCDKSPSRASISNPIVSFRICRFFYGTGCSKDSDPTLPRCSKNPLHPLFVSLLRILGNVPSFAFFPSGGDSGSDAFSSFRRDPSPGQLRYFPPDPPQAPRIQSTPLFLLVKSP